MPKKTLLLAAIFAFAGLTMHAAQPADSEPEEKSGITVTVEFYVNAAGQVSEARVIEREADALDEFALAMVNAGRLNPNPLPAADSKPRQIRAPLFFPVENYEGNQPLPEGTIKPVPRIKVPPRYPYECRVRGINGGVLVAITVAANGTVKECRF